MVIVSSANCFPLAFERSGLPQSVTEERVLSPDSLKEDVLPLSSSPEGRLSFCLRLTLLHCWILDFAAYDDENMCQHLEREI